ncbi:MFS transporter [Streptomyces sp. NPDC048111]|uniref:MFS transporter n=1 Tax=Streptomyces sp. NPDC048111 TaxID=3365500 RepID=UPI00371175B2
MSSDSRWGPRVAALCSVQLLVAMEFSIANVALPDIGHEFRVGAEGLQWVLSAYALAYGSILLCAGRFADALGLRRILLRGLAAFAVASLAAAVAPTFAVLAVARAAQGAAAAFATPAALGLITTLPSRRHQVLALSWWGAGGSLGFALGAVMGGVITQLAGWPAVFVFCAALAGVSALMTLRWVPEFRPRETAERPDGLSALLLGGSAASGIALLSLAPHPRTQWWAAALCLAATVGCALALRAWQGRGRTPLLPPGFLARPAVRLANLVSAWAPAAGGSMVYFATMLMQHTLGWSQSATGLMLLPDAAAAALGARSARHLHGRLGTVGTYCCGLAAIAAGMAVLAATPTTSAAATACVLLGTCLTGFGLVLAAVVAAVAAAERLGPDEHGVSGGLLITTQQLGVAFGLALLLMVSDLGTGGALSTAGLRLSFLGGAVLAALGCAVVVVVRRAGRRSPASTPPGVTEGYPVRRAPKG